MRYNAEKLRPGDEDRALSEAISGALKHRKEDAGGTLAQRAPAPGQMVAKACEAVTSLTGGNRVSETMQPSAATGTEFGSVLFYKSNNNFVRRKTHSPVLVIDHELTRNYRCDAGEEVKKGYGAEGLVVHGEEIGGARLNTNTM